MEQASTSKDRAEGTGDEHKNPYIVKFATNEARVFKKLIAFFHGSLTTLVFRISAMGITLRNNNSTETLLADLHLRKQEFTSFLIPEGMEQEDEHGEYPELKFAMEAELLQRITKSILMKDKMKLFVEKDKPDWIQIVIKNKARGRRLEGLVKLLQIDDLDEEFTNPMTPCKFLSTNPCAVGSAQEFQKACKSAKETKSKIILVKAQKNSVRVSGGSGAVVTKGFTFGKWLRKEKEKKGSETIYEALFDSKIMEAVSKACPMSKKVRFYCEEEKPLLISLDACSLGVLDIYLVSKKPETTE